MITLSIRYTIDARKRQDFEQYARALGPIIPRCGGKVVGYWLPTKFAGPTNAALALIDFESLAAYEQYRERLAKARLGWRENEVQDVRPAAATPE